MSKGREIWKSIPGYEGYYEASNHGRIRSVERYVEHNYGGLAKKKSRILKPDSTTGGYYSIRLHKENRSYKTQLGRLVLMAFTGKRPRKLECNHVDGDKHNNCIENLEWVTRSENHRHKYDVLGYVASEETRQKMSRTRKGKKHTAKALKRMSEARMGIVFSEEHKRNLSIAAKRRRKKEKESCQKGQLMLCI